MARNRFVDMHFFDIVGAQEGDQFVVGVMAGDYSLGEGADLWHLIRRAARS